MKINNKTKKLAKIIWDYHKMNQKVEKADCILVLGSHDTRVAERGIELYLQGFAPWLIFSGGQGILTKRWGQTEADKFAKIALKKDVPEKNILIENKASNTGENIVFTYKFLKKKNILPKSIILVQKPYMERRTYATFMKQWPGKKVKIFVTSPKITFETYPNKKISWEKVINIMVGDLQRIQLYPKRGLQIYQKIPKKVWSAFKELVKMGYAKHLIK